MVKNGRTSQAMWGSPNAINIYKPIRPIIWGKFIPPIHEDFGVGLLLALPQYGFLSAMISPKATFEFSWGWSRHVKTVKI